MGLDCPVALVAPRLRPSRRWRGGRQDAIDASRTPGALVVVYNLCCARCDLAADIKALGKRRREEVRPTWELGVLAL